MGLRRWVLAGIKQAGPAFLKETPLCVFARYGTVTCMLVYEQNNRCHGRFDAAFCGCRGKGSCRVGQAGVTCSCTSRGSFMLGFGLARRGNSRGRLAAEGLGGIECERVRERAALHGISPQTLRAAPPASMLTVHSFVRTRKPVDAQGARGDSRGVVSGWRSVLAHPVLPPPPKAVVWRRRSWKAQRNPSKSCSTLNAASVPFFLSAVADVCPPPTASSAPRPRHRSCSSVPQRPTPSSQIFSPPRSRSTCNLSLFARILRTAAVYLA